MSPKTRKMTTAKGWAWRTQQLPRPLNTSHIPSRFPSHKDTSFANTPTIPPLLASPLPPAQPLASNRGSHHRQRPPTPTSAGLARQTAVVPPVRPCWRHLSGRCSFKHCKYSHAPLASFTQAELEQNLVSRTSIFGVISFSLCSLSLSLFVCVCVCVDVHATGCHTG